MLKKIEKTILKECYKDIEIMGLINMKKSNYFRWFQKGLIKQALYETKIKINRLDKGLVIINNWNNGFLKANKGNLKGIGLIAQFIFLNLI